MKAVVGVVVVVAVVVFVTPVIVTLVAVIVVLRVIVDGMVTRLLSLLLLQIRIEVYREALICIKNATKKGTEGPIDENTRTNQLHTQKISSIRFLCYLCLFIWSFLCLCHALSRSQPFPYPLRIVCIAPYILFVCH